MRASITHDLGNVTLLTPATKYSFQGLCITCSMFAWVADRVSPGVAREILRISSSALANFALILWHVLALCHAFLLYVTSRSLSPASGVAAGKRVLVTTGRQVKTLHIVRALKDVGATVIVSDYQDISTSAVSLACDRFIKLPALDATRLDEWIENFGNILRDESIDVVLPVSTINEVLFVAAAKKTLSPVFPHVQWLAPDLDIALKLDDRDMFSTLCEQFKVPAPMAGILRSLDDLADAPFDSEKGLVVKRIESSVNRQEEIVFLTNNEPPPKCVSPTTDDPWQWQTVVVGEEYSVWYICKNGQVFFSACYKSDADLVQFDSVPVPQDIDTDLRRLIKGMSLTGQFAFDFIREEKTGRALVIECNPRASSILETVANTPLWGEAFFGVDVSKRMQTQDVGFWFHKNCWPWTARVEGTVSVKDPLPFFASQIVWPLWAIATVGMTGIVYRKIDVNIGKIIVDGHSSARSLNVFKDRISEERLMYLKEALKYVEFLMVDSTLSRLDAIEKASQEADCAVIRFRTFYCTTSGKKTPVMRVEDTEDDADDLMDRLTASGKEYRVLISPTLARETGRNEEITLLMRQAGQSLRESNIVSLHKLRLLHVVGSCTSEFYETLSAMYGMKCILSVQDNVRFSHIIAYVHQSGEWTITEGKTLEYIRMHAEKLSVGAAIMKIETLNCSVVVPHMFDYAGLTAYRSLFDVLSIPQIGCTGEALALSTNKARTKACAAAAGVQMPKSEVIRFGEEVSMQPPFIVKPTEEDNSLGIQVVRHSSEVKSALAEAFKYGDEVMCEEFIGLGRELRVGLIETKEGGLKMLPAVEYLFSEGSSIRTPQDKLTTNEAGIPTSMTPCRRVIPAELDLVLKEKLWKTASVAHRALGCRDYSIYDFRIDENGEPFMLESSLYCSFAPSSVIVIMAEGEGIEHPQLFVEFVERTFAQHEKQCKSVTGQKFGMKRKL